MEYEKTLLGIIIGEYKYIQKLAELNREKGKQLGEGCQEDQGIAAIVYVENKEWVGLDHWGELGFINSFKLYPTSTEFINGEPLYTVSFPNRSSTPPLVHSAGEKWEFDLRKWNMSRENLKAKTFTLDGRATNYFEICASNHSFLK